MTTAVAIVLALQPAICTVSTRTARPALDMNVACGLFRSTTIADIVMLSVHQQKEKRKVIVTNDEQSSFFHNSRGI